MAGIPGVVRGSLGVLVALLMLATLASATDPCPAANSVDGIFATGYRLSDGEILTDGSLHLPTSFSMREPEEAGRNLASQVLTITCANISGNGCDGAESTTPGNVGNISTCMGCAGTVSVAITGIGHGNATRFGSTCEGYASGLWTADANGFWTKAAATDHTVVCTPDGHPFVNGKSAQGVWNASGTCRKEYGMGQGTCACEIFDGAVLTPDGPWQLTAPSDLRCTCNENGTISPPPLWYNRTFTPRAAWFNHTWNGDAPWFNATSSVTAPWWNATVSVTDPWWNATVSVTDPWYNATVSVTDPWWNHTVSVTDPFYTSTASSTDPFYNVTFTNASCSAANCACSSEGVATDDTGDTCGCACDYTTCSAANCTCATDGTPSGPDTCGCGCAYQECSLANCTCGSDGTPAGPADCGCGCDYEVCTVGNCTCGADGVASGPTGCGCGCDYEVCTVANCTCGADGTAIGPDGCGCGCDYEVCTVANCTCGADGSPIGPDGCGCGCDYEECTASNCTCGVGGYHPSDGTPSGPDGCGCGCEEIVCGVQNCTCGDGSINPADGTPSGPDTCGCGCEHITYSCSQANCTCGDGSTYPADNTTVGADDCNCFCAPVQETVEQNNCGCEREDCQCACEELCTAGCSPDPCGTEVLDEDKSWKTTGGYTCQVQASCAGGFYGGASFTALTASVHANLKRDSVDLGQEYLTGYSNVLRGGAVAFGSLKVKRTASETKGYTVYYGVYNGTHQVTTTGDIPVFKVAPNYFKVHQSGLGANDYLTATEYFVGTDQTAEMGMYNITLLELDGSTVITLVDDTDGYAASLTLLTTENGPGDVSYNVGGSDTGHVSLGLQTSQGGALTEKLLIDGSTTMGFKLSVTGSIGFFQIGIHLNSTLTSDKTRDQILQGKDGSTYSPFTLSPNKTVVSYAAGSFYNKEVYPRVVHQGGTPSPPMEDGGPPKDGGGLPNPLVVHFLDADGMVINGAMPHCSQCVHARLVQCDDSMSAQMPYPTCATVAQARCAASSPGKCANSGTSGDADWRHTLSGTTTVDMVNGTANFTNLQIEHTWGAGFRLEFVLSSPSALDFGGGVSYHTTGMVSVPETGNVWPNNSFFVRPFGMAVVQHPGGDGVDIDKDGLADGTGAGLPIRRQPHVILTGNGYNLSSSLNLNGYTPVQALIHAQQCGGNKTFLGDCALDLIGLLVPPADGAARYAAATNAPDFAGDLLQFVAPSSAEAVTFSSTKPQALYRTGLGSVGVEYSDLILSPTNGTKMVRQDVVLEFRVGPNIEGIDSYTSTLAKPVDMFHVPNTPANLRATSVGALGFRLDWDPPAISRSSPLTGFIVEVVKCSQVESVNDTCISKLNPHYAASFNFKQRLGTDLSLGGGYTQETLLNWGVPNELEYLTSSIIFITHKTLRAGDALLIELGPRVRMLDTFVTPCELEGELGHRFEISVLPFNSTLLLTVAPGHAVYESELVNVTIPITCQLHTPGGSAPPANFDGYLFDFQKDPDSYVPQVGDLPRILHAPVVGSADSVRFDNCKGTQTCTKVSSFELPSVQDGSSMDVDWFGGLQHGGVGAGDSGQNGAPVAGASAYGDTDEACRSGKGSKNPCALTIGHDWTDVVELQYMPLHPGSVTLFAGVTAKIRRNRALVAGDLITFSIPWSMTHNTSACDIMSENATAAYNMMFGMPNASASEAPDANATNSTDMPVPAPDPCGFLITSATYRGVTTFDWSSTWTAGVYPRDSRPLLGLRTFGVTVPRSIPGQPFDEIAIHIVGFTARAEVPTGSRLPKSAPALIRRKRRTSVVFRDGATMSSSTGQTALDPIGTYLEGLNGPGLAAITGNSIYNFRVKAYNARFRGTAAETKVQNRAIMPPATPALFTQMSQEAIGVRLFYSNFIGQVDSSPFPQYLPTKYPSPGDTTRIGVRIKPTRRIGAGESFTFKLPGFTSSVPMVIFNSTGPYKIWADTYQVTPNSTGACACDAAGTTFTPRNIYRVTRQPTGLGACNVSSPTPSTGNETNGTGGIGEDAFCACGGCDCSLAGVVTTPPTIYIEQFNCSGCSCDHTTGIVTQPPTEYNTVGNDVCMNEAGNQTLCECDSSGVPSGPEFEAVGSCTNCSCSGAGVDAVATDGATNCSSCSCDFRSCGCQCLPIVCDCACPVNVSCACDCPIEATHECGCHQTEPTLQISRAVWSTYTSALTLTVAPGSSLAAGAITTVWFDPSGGIMFPPGSVVPKGPSGLSGAEAIFNRFKLNWVSPFPTALKPRLGFLIQMTSDFYWKTDVQSFFVPDELDGGTDRLAILTQLRVDMAAVDTYIQVLLPQDRLVRGDIIKIDGEYMEVQKLHNDSTAIEVLRGVLATTPQAHTVVTGGAACACDANNTATGGTGCVCTKVFQKLRGATDVGIDGDGIDTATGFLGTQCSQGVKNAAQGCNPTGYIFNGTRTFQSAFITDALTQQINFYGACGTDPSVCSTGACMCNAPPLLVGAELGNLAAQAVGVASIQNTGDPLFFPYSITTTTVHAVLDDVSVANIAVLGNSRSLQGKYIRIDEEIMFVRGVSRGVRKIATSKALGGSQCSCSVVGKTASGGTTCSCIGADGVNCTEGGVLTGQGGSGLSFKADFNVSDGAVSDITVTNPGAGYKGAGPIVTIFNDETGCVFSASTWFVTTTDHVLSVTRAALGTIRGRHAANAIVSVIPWPSNAKVSTQVPGLQYHFRIAAVNNAGISNFLYHELKLYSVFPRTIPGVGGTEMEIIMIGGHTTAANLTFYIGQTKADGSPNYLNSKKCGATRNLDAGGTRVTCSSPPGNGASWDLIAVSKSGSVNRIEVGSSWIRYEFPQITMIAPAQVDAGANAKFTITGKNFGAAKDPLTGYLDATTGKIPCTPLVHISDNQAVCLIFPKKGEVMTGNIILTAGNATTGGGQATATSPTTSYVKEKPAPVEVKATIAVEITAIAEGTPARTAFVASFLSDISGALGVPASRLEVTGIVAGSVIVVFNIIPDAASTTTPSPAALAVSLAVQAADPTSALRATSLGGAISVSIPAGTADLAAAEAAAETVVVGEVPLWESQCVTKTYTAFDMIVCYECCTEVCEIGDEVPQVAGQDVLSGYRAELCQSLCMTHCGYERPFTAA